MFESLSERLGGILDKLTKRGALSEADVNEAMREVRRALIEADVALDVVRSFTDKVRARAVGQDVIRSVTPGQMALGRAFAQVEAEVPEFGQGDGVEIAHRMAPER